MNEQPSQIQPGSSLAASLSMAPLVQATQTLTRLTVSLRLRLLLGALMVILLCSAALFWLNARDEIADRVLYQRVESTLDATHTAQQAKDTLVALRRNLVIAATDSVVAAPGSDRLGSMQAAIDAHQPAVLQSAAALESIDSAAALRVRTAAEALAQTALLGIAELATGQVSAGADHFLQFTAIGTPAEVALEALLARQQQGLQTILDAAAAQQQQTQTLLRVLHTVMLALAAAAAFMLSQAIFRPLQRLYAALRSIAKGEPLTAPPVTGNDEFGQLGTALHELSQLTTQLNSLAFNDALTGLPNRMQFDHDLAASLADDCAFAVVFADIDHFRTINDGYGHFFGDQVLKAAASRLQWLLQGDTRLYRYSGDLFAVCIKAGTPFEAGAFQPAIAVESERLRSRMGEPLVVQDRRIPLCMSLGVSLYPEDGTTTEALVSAADAAMFQAKQMGRNVVQFARKDSALKARQRIELADDLRIALRTGALSPHFQPIVDLGSGHIVCAEALARWKHPTRGCVPPDEFIGIAEDSGQIDLLTEQLLRSACHTAVQWQGSNGRPPPRLAFNLSARQVRQGVVEMVSQVLEESGLPASRLEVEITESAIIERPETAERLLNELRELGVSVALDDFGTGYSSLSYLLRFPIDKIKIDRSFVAQLNGQRQAGKIVAATITLATNLEITLVAEGVETVGQMVTLYELGCRQQQGWLFSKALPAEDFNRWALHAPLRLDAVVRAQAEPANEIQPAA